MVDLELGTVLTQIGQTIGLILDGPWSETGGAGNARERPPLSSAPSASHPSMAKLTYSMLCSLDGYIEDAEGHFDWLTPSPELHAFINEVERSIGTYLYGRRLYETMAVWENDPSIAAHSPEMAEYATIWAPADKIVYSSTLDAVSTTRTELRREFDADEIRRLKAGSDRNLTVGGPTLAAQAFAAGLVDEVGLYVAPIIVGGGKTALPADVRLDLDLIDERRFSDGTVYLRYQHRGISAVPAPRNLTASGLDLASHLDLETR